MSRRAFAALLQFERPGSKRFQNFQLIDMPRCLVLKIFSRLRRRCLRNSCAAYASVTGRFSAKQGDVGALGHKARSMMESESYDRSY